MADQVAISAPSLADAAPNPNWPETTVARSGRPPDGARIHQDRPIICHAVTIAGGRPAGSGKEEIPRPVTWTGPRNGGQARPHRKHGRARTMTTPTDCPSPVRILSALERQPGAWIRTGPRSIEHAGLRVRLTLGIISVRFAHIIPDGRHRYHWNERSHRAGGFGMDAP